jgi:four helix bundle protein
MSDFKNLKVWQEAQTLALDTHRVACGIRGADHRGLRIQMINAAMSVPTNIVESRGQATAREGCRYLRIALNSATELDITC